MGLDKENSRVSSNAMKRVLNLDDFYVRPSVALTSDRWSVLARRHEIYELGGS